MTSREVQLVMFEFKNSQIRFSIDIGMNIFFDVISGLTQSPATDLSLL